MEHERKLAVVLLALVVCGLLGVRLSRRSVSKSDVGRWRPRVAGSCSPASCSRYGPDTFGENDEAL